MSTISLLSDFGFENWRIGAMKGAMYDIYPGIRIADLSHARENCSIDHASLILAGAYSYFAYGSIHVVAIATETSTPPVPVLLESRGHYFIGPDNGIFAKVDHPTSALTILDKKEYHRRPSGQKFLAADVLAAVAAYLARGVPPDQLGTRQNRRITLPEKSLHGAIRLDSLESSALALQSDRR